MPRGWPTCGLPTFWAESDHFTFSNQSLIEEHLRNLGGFTRPRRAERINRWDCCKAALRGCLTSSMGSCSGKFMQTFGIGGSAQQKTEVFMKTSAEKFTTRRDGSIICVTRGKHLRKFGNLHLPTLALAWLFKMPIVAHLFESAFTIQLFFNRRRALSTDSPFLILTSLNDIHILSKWSPGQVEPEPKWDRKTWTKCQGLSILKSTLDGMLKACFMR